MTQDDHIARLQDVLGGIARDVGGVRGVLLATRDGHPITHTLPRHDDGDASLSTAAMIAALLGIGDRLSQLTGDPTLLEATVRSPGGSVVIYAVGDDAVLTVLTDASVNLARLHLAARLEIGALRERLEARERSRIASRDASLRQARRPAREVVR